MPFSSKTLYVELHTQGRDSTPSVYRNPFRQLENYDKGVDFRP